MTLLVLAVSVQAHGETQPQASNDAWAKAMLVESGLEARPCPDGMKDSFAGARTWCAVFEDSSKRFKAVWEKAYTRVRRKHEDLARRILAVSRWTEADGAIKKSYRTMDGVFDVAQDPAAGGVVLLHTPHHGPMFDRLIAAGERVLMADAPVPGATPPRRTHHEFPDYPERARRERVSAYVLLEMLIGEGGHVVEVGVMECNKPGRGFEEAARRAALRWRYDPATLDGDPIVAYSVVSVTFEIR